MPDKPKVHIENWWISSNRLHGEVQDHPRFKSGVPVTTSPIVEQPFLVEEGDEIETLNTIYILGKEKEKE